MESINDIAIKLSVDAEGVSRGFRTAAEETRAYQKELERLVYAVGKNDPVDYNAHVTQYTQATEARLAKEKKAQEEFNAWYRAEADKEFQAWYAVELKKENVRQQQLAQERQSAINTFNAGNFQPQLPAETSARTAENAKLQDYIVQKYAILAQEERAVRDNAYNIAESQRRKVLDAERLQQMEMDSLRQYMQQKYALLAEEERNDQLNANNSAEIQRVKAMKVKQTADQAVAQKAADFAAYKAQLAQEEAASTQNAERMSQLAQNNAVNILEIQRLSGAKAAAARELELNDLRTAITARYALLEQEERAQRDNASNRAAAQARATAAAQQAHQQDLDNLREYITQKYAILNREEAIERMNASNAAEIARMRTLQSQQAAARANAQRDSDFAAYKADLARQEAAGMVNAQRTARIERARQLDAKRAADDDRVRQLNDWRMQQAMMQRAAIDTQLTVAAMGGGFGGTAMAMGQLSYAAEDFIQVLAMGGGLNMALMSASNNLSMVARALIGTSGVMSAVAGFAIPVLLIGTGMLIQYLMREEDQLDAVTRAYERLRKEMKLTSDLRMIELEHSFDMEDIDALSSYAAAMSRLKQEVRDLARAETEIAALEEQIAAQRNAIRDTVAGGTIIADAQSQLDWLIYMQGVIDADQNDIAEATKQLKNLTEAYADLSDTMKNGTPDEIIRAAEEFERVINESDQLFAFPGVQTEKLKAILGSEDDDVAKLDALRQLMADIAVEEDKRLKMEEEMLKLQEKRDQLLRQETQLRQDEMRFRLEATDAQKEELEIRKQLAEFIGVNATGMDFGDMSADQAGQSREFLELLWRNLKQQREDLLDEQRKITPTGGLEQNTFQAQADAFKQILEAQNKEDPQLASIDRRMQQVNQYLEIITQIPGFQIIQ
jgi:hypothetical protein